MNFSRLSFTKDALSVKRIIALPTVIGVVFLILRVLPALTHGDSQFLGVSDFIWAAGAGCLLFFGFIFENGHRLYVSIQPKFDITFHPDDDGLGIVAAIDRVTKIVPGPNGLALQTQEDIPTRYIRIQIDVLSKLTIKDCRACISSLHKKAEGQSNFKRIPLSHEIFLRPEPFHIYPDMSNMVDFLKTNKTRDKIFFPDSIGWPIILENVFDDKGTYRFTFKVMSGEGISRTKSIDIIWDGHWDKVTGKEVD